MGGDEEGLRLAGIGTLNEEGPTLPLEVLEEEMAAAEALTMWDALEHELEV